MFTYYNPGTHTATSASASVTPAAARSVQMNGSAIRPLVARDRDVEAAELAALGIEEVYAGLFDGDADQIGAPGRAHRGIGDLGGPPPALP
jgi:hypothetical protein